MDALIPCSRSCTHDFMEALLELELHIQDDSHCRFACQYIGTSSRVLIYDALRLHPTRAKVSLLRPSEGACVETLDPDQGKYLVPPQYRSKISIIKLRKLAALATNENDFAFAVKYLSSPSETLKFEEGIYSGTALVTTLSASNSQGTQQPVRGCWQYCCQSSQGQHQI
jgi:hypothetical protein